MPFIVGCGRSGNTLLRMMLDSSPEMAIPPETEVIVAAAEAGGDANTFCATVTDHWRFADMHIDASLFRSRVQSLRAFSTADGLRELYRCYAEKFGKSRYGDKTPYYATYLPLIASLFPEARAIHIIRDGRAVAASMLPLWFGPNDAAEMGRYWTEIITTIRATATMPTMEVRYESLVQQPDVELRAIFEFCELEWHDSVLRYHERAPDRVREVTTDAPSVDGAVLAPVHRRHEIHRRLGHPPDPDRIDAWRDELSPGDLAAFMCHAAPMMRELGYV